MRAACMRCAQGGAISGVNGATSSLAWRDAVAPVKMVQLVSAEGKEVEPSRCTRRADALSAGAAASSCVFVKQGFVDKSKPVMTPTGPVFLQMRRLVCKAHGGEFCYHPASLPLLLPGQHFRPQLIFLGRVCTCGAT